MLRILGSQNVSKAIKSFIRVKSIFALLLAVNPALQLHPTVQDG
jgi:hypothetical protein